MKRTKLEADLIGVQRMVGGGNIIEIPVKLCDVEVYLIEEGEDDAEKD